MRQRLPLGLFIGLSVILSAACGPSPEDKAAAALTEAAEATAKAGAEIAKAGEAAANAAQQAAPAGEQAAKGMEEFAKAMQGMAAAMGGANGAKPADPVSFRECRRRFRPSRAGRWTSPRANG